MSGTGYPHLVRDERGRLLIEDTMLNRLSLLAEHLYWGLDANALTEGHPPLTLGQAHSLLAYYYDHQAQVDAETSQHEREAEALRADLEDARVAGTLREGYPRWRAGRQATA
jgi:hypothetical protein